MTAKPKKAKNENKPERLAKGPAKASGHAPTKPKGKSSPRPRAGRHPGRTIDHARQSSPLARLIQSLGQEEIRFQIVGMTAGVLQGVMINTLDTDIWVDLPTRRYIRLWKIIREQGGTALSPTLYVLSDGKLVNFLFSVTGLRRFAAEFANTIVRKLDGLEVKVLSLERILKSKQTIRRDKDLVHIRLIKDVLEGRKSANTER